MTKQQILVLGATGFVGKKLVKRLLDMQYSVKVLVRDPLKLQGLSDAENLEVVNGAYFDLALLKEVLAEAQIVLTTLSPKPFSRVSKAELQQYKASFHELVKVLGTKDENRLIHIAGTTIKLDGEQMSSKRKRLRLIMKTLAKPSVLLKDFELKTLAESKLNWTSIKSPLIRVCP
ncbi:MAG: NAD(P)H-binding protein [Bacteroidota bacterium]